MKTIQEIDSVDRGDLQVNSDLKKKKIATVCLKIPPF